jgi:hypothetical protein
LLGHQLTFFPYICVAPDETVCPKKGLFSTTIWKRWGIYFIYKGTLFHSVGAAKMKDLSAYDFNLNVCCSEVPAKKPTARRALAWMKKGATRVTKR